MATRLVLIKADGSVSIHSDDRAYKPLNWMSPPCWLTEDGDTWTVRNKNGEQLIITVDEVRSEERRVGKESRWRWSACSERNKRKDSGRIARIRETSK